jgi:dolichyl-phosphate-mannose-protein mannosyltransferase
LGQQWILAGGALLLALTVGLGAATGPGYPTDSAHYKYWTRLVTLEGIHRAYRGTWPETYAIYPPVHLYYYRLVGEVYRQAVDPTFERDRALGSPLLTFLLKVPAVLAHAAAAGVVYLITRSRLGFGLALLAMAAYAFNPALIFTVSHWGQPDSVHTLFLLAGFGFLGTGRVMAAWAAFALAAMSKPQAWVLLPLAAWASLRWFGPGRTLGGLGVGAAVGLGLTLPFILGGTVDELLTLPVQTASVMPVASANAHNLWWLLTQGRGLSVPDSAPFIGPVSYRAGGLGLTAAAVVAAMLGVGGRPDPWRGWLLAAVTGFGFFMFAPQVHENHLFFVPALLAPVLPAGRLPAIAFGLVSFTYLVNLAVADPVLNLFDETVRWVLGLGNAGLNLGTFVFLGRLALGARKGGS